MVYFVICNKFKLLTSRRAGLSIVPVVPWEGPRRQGAPDQLQNFYHTVLTFERAMYAV